MLTRQHLLLLCGLVATLAMAVGCGGRQNNAVGGEGILVGDGPSLLGELEARAQGFLLDMAFVLESNRNDPARAVDRFQALFAVNGEEMLENARAIEARFAEFEGPERRRYEAQLAAYMNSALTEWREQSTAFQRANPTEGRTVLQLVELHDHE